VVTAYTVLLLAVAGERVAELFVSQRHLRWARERGALEAGQGHYPAMVVLHVALLVGCLVEVHALDRPFLAWLGWPMLVLVGAAQALRWWCIATLGPQWNTRVVVVPGLPLVRTGPYRWLRHPNYLAVVAEGVALPLVHSAWLTALVFTVLNGLLLTVRIRCENRVLHDGAASPDGKPVASQR
jgi:methyltransferase